MVGISSNVNLTSALLGGASNSINPKVSDVITGNAGGISSVVSASVQSSLGSSSNLTSSQQSSFSNLENFISDNVADETVKFGLLKDLAALQSILENGDTAANLDPVFSLLAGLNELNSETFGSFSNGLVVDSLF